MKGMGKLSVAPGTTPAFQPGSRAPGKPCDIQGHKWVQRKGLPPGVEGYPAEKGTQNQEQVLGGRGQGRSEPGHHGTNMDGKGGRGEYVDKEQEV